MKLLSNALIRRLAFLRVIVFLKHHYSTAERGWCNWMKSVPALVLCTLHLYWFFNINSPYQYRLKFYLHQVQLSEPFLSKYLDIFHYNVPLSFFMLLKRFLKVGLPGLAYNFRVPFPEAISEGYVGMC